MAHFEQLTPVILVVLAEPGNPVPRSLVVLVRL